MKKILNIISQYPSKTGSGIYLESIIREGKKVGHNQGLIAALNFGGDYSNKNVDKFYPICFETKNLPFPIVGMSDVMPYRSTRYSDLDKEKLRQWERTFKDMVIKAIHDFEPDVIISHHLWILTSIVIDLAKGIKILGICHGTDIRQLKNNPQYRDKVIKNIRELDTVISLNRIQSKKISEYYGVPLQNIKIVGGGFNQDIFYRGNKLKNNQSIKLIYVGKLSYQKGIVSLIKVFKRMKKKYPVQLTIVGSGFGEEGQYIRKIGKDKDIYFKGEVPQWMLGNLYRESDIFVLPSFYEGLSLVTLEALASGLLTVVSEISGLKDFLGQAINESGAIEYITLPEMRYSSLPKGKELKLFELDLEYKLEKQIDRYLKGYSQTKDVKKQIDKNSWNNIYREIEKNIF